MRAGKVHEAHGVNILRLGPFAITLAPVDQIFLVLCRDMHRLCIGAAPAPAAAHHKLRIALHAGIPSGQNLLVSVLLPENIRHDHTCIGPADAAVHGVHIEIRTAGRCDLWKAAALALPVIHVVQKFLSHGLVIKQEAGRRTEDLRVAGPAVTLSCRTISGQIGMVVFCTPDRVFHKFVQQRIGTFKPARAFHIGIDRNGGKILCLEWNLRLYQHIAEAENRKHGFICVCAILAGIDDLLQGRGKLVSGKLNILLREFSVFVQHFAETKRYGLSRPRRQRKGSIARDVLSEVQHGFPRRRTKKLCVQTLMLPDRNIVRR